MRRIADGSERVGAGQIGRAAAYVRMSTERQNYSIHHQRLAIDDYAARHGLSIVETYADHGKSGLRLEGRDGLQRLMARVTSGAADFHTIIVYDVSRWGRFQDADESAYHEFVCRRAGIQVVYCAETFGDEDSPMAALLKSLKRAMASEYSRELSAKVFAAQSNFILMGFKQGGAAGYGLRRMAIDQSGSPKIELGFGERKQAHTDRVVLAPGPPDEAMVVEAIYDSYLRLKLGDQSIARMLNDAGVPAERGRPWSKKMVHSVLTNEKYAGHAIYNRSSYKLKKRSVKNPPAMWIRKDGAYPALVSPERFANAQMERALRHRRYRDEELLDILREIHARHGTISARLISSRAPSPTPQTFKYHFGTLARAYDLAGVGKPESFAYVESRQVLRKVRADLTQRVEALIRDAGGDSAPIGLNALRINGAVSLKIMVVRCQREGSGNRWRARLSEAEGADFLIAAQMDAANRIPLGFYLVPMAECEGAWLALPPWDATGHALARHRSHRLDDMFLRGKIEQQLPLAPT